MKPKHRRLFMVVASLIVMGLAASAILYSFRDNMIFFFTPTQWQEKQTDPAFSKGRSVRIGGLVKKSSVVNQSGGGLAFVVTDFTHELRVEYRGMVPSLFREGQGVVAQGKFDATGVLQAETILAKHDENYMPREVMEAIKASGQWKEYGPAKNTVSP